MTIETLLGDLIAAQKETASALAENTAALTAHTDFLRSLSAKTAAKAAEAEPAPKAAPAKAAPAKAAEPDDEGEEEAAPVKRTRSAAAEKAPVKAAAKPATKPAKAPTPQQMADATTAFIDVEDEAEYDDRRALVKKIIAKFGAKKMSEIDESNRQKALDMLEAHKAGDDPFDGEDDESLA